MNQKKIFIAGFCLGLLIILYCLVRYQMDFADEPVEGKDIIHILAHHKDLSTMSDLIKKSGLHQLLEKADSLTLIAPTNKAFEQLHDMLGDEAYNRIMHDATSLQKLLEHHIILKKESTDTMTNDEKLHTLEGTSIHVSKSAQGTLRLDNNASIIPSRSNIEAGKVMIHSVDEVMMPEKLE